MSPALKYSLARLGLFVLAAAVLFVLPLPVDPLLRLMIAVLVSAGLSWFLLRRWRDEVASQLAAANRRRAEARARLREALAGDDDSGAAEP